MQLAFMAPANEDNFWLEIVGGGEAAPKEIYANLNESLHPAGYHHFCLDVDNVDETLAELRRREVVIVTEAFDLPIIGKRIAFLADPSGNLIEVAGKLK
jgi:glyoxylase I family protein